MRITVKKKEKKNYKSVKLVVFVLVFVLLVNTVPVKVSAAESKEDVYLKEMDKYAWLLDDLQNIPEEDLEEYVRSIKSVKSWAVSMDQKVDGLMDKVG